MPLDDTGVGEEIVPWSYPTYTRRWFDLTRTVSRESRWKSNYGSKGSRGTPNIWWVTLALRSHPMCNTDSFFDHTQVRQHHVICKSSTLLSLDRSYCTGKQEMKPQYTAISSTITTPTTRPASVRRKRATRSTRLPVFNPVILMYSPSRPRVRTELWVPVVHLRLSELVMVCMIVHTEGRV